MKDLIWGIIGIVIALFGAVYLIKLMLLKKSGVETVAEVIAVREKKKGAYVHTLRFGEWEKDDTSGFSQPFNVGDMKEIVYNPKKPSQFEYKEELKKNIIIAAALIAMALVFSAKWLVSGVGAM